jgi:hypothetical protein
MKENVELCIMYDGPNSNHRGGHQGQLKSRYLRLEV